MRLLFVAARDAHAPILSALTIPTIDADHVSDMQAVLQALDACSYDALLVDDDPPALSGPEVLAAVRARGLDVPIVVLAHGARAAACVSTGASECLHKEEDYLQRLGDFVLRVQAQHRVRVLQEEVERRNGELEKAHHRLAEYGRRIIESEKTNGVLSMVRGLCHELNNPLTGILGYAQLLQEIWVGEGLDDLKEIESCAQRCRDIIGKLARFCRVEKGAHVLVDINAAVDETLEFMDYYATRYRVKITRDPQPDLPQTLGSLPDLRHALLAVFLNAVQSMIPKKGGVLAVKTCSGDGLIRVVITDTGEGIPAENLEHVVAPFFTTRKAGEGKGMGLAIAYGILQEHEGALLVDSVVAQGTTVSFVMPVRAGATPPASATPVSAGHEQ